MPRGFDDGEDAAVPRVVGEDEHLVKDLFDSMKSNLEAMIEEQTRGLREQIREWSCKQAASMERIETLCRKGLAESHQRHAAPVMPAVQVRGMHVEAASSLRSHHRLSSGQGGHAIEPTKHVSADVATFDGHPHFTPDDASSEGSNGTLQSGPRRAKRVHVASTPKTLQRQQHLQALGTPAAGASAGNVAGFVSSICGGSAGTGSVGSVIGAAQDGEIDAAPKPRRSLMGEMVSRTSMNALQSLQTRLSSIENKFNKDFMSRGSLFAPSEVSNTSTTQDIEENDHSPTQIRIQSMIKALVDHPSFDVCCGLVILMNTALIGVETQQLTQSLEPDPVVHTIQSSIVFIFAFELVLRMLAEGFREFLTGLEWRWNLFDTMLVLMSLLDYGAEKLEMAGYASMARTVRVLRVVRILRSLRIFRVLRYVREFRKMIFAIQGSMQTLLWSLLLLFFFLYSFAVVMTTGVAEYVHHQPDGKIRDQQETAALEESYGSLMRSFYSLYLAMSQGRAWGELLSPLMPIGDFFVLTFLAFITITVFGVLNVVTSVFVESAMRTAQHYRELLVQDKQRDLENIVRHMREVFQQIDDDGSGQISMAEMEHFLTDPDLRMYVEALDINTADTRVLFRLLDKDDSGKIDIDEFCDGCLRVKGPAKGFDIHCILHEVERQSSKWGEFMGFAETRLLTLEALIHHVAAAVDPEFASSGVSFARRASSRGNTPGTSSIDVCSHLLTLHPAAGLSAFLDPLPEAVSQTAASPHAEEDTDVVNAQV